MPANVRTIAYYGDVPWHKLGTKVPKGVTAEQMIRDAGLDWEVELRPARGAQKINRKDEFSRYEVVRVPRPTTKETEVLLGVVSRRYKPLQNAEAFKFFDPIVGDKKAYFETAAANIGSGKLFDLFLKQETNKKVSLTPLPLRASRPQLSEQLPHGYRHPEGLAAFGEKVAPLARRAFRFWSDQFTPRKWRVGVVESGV